MKKTLEEILKEKLKKEGVSDKWMQEHLIVIDGREDKKDKPNER
tara:strand:+ start:6965 stop:7096 length:132 start_codon:yes stop_codon:yes gene_type:complete